MSKTFRCTIVTPVASVLDEKVTYASFPAWDGQMGVLAGRSPLLTRLGIGSLRLDFEQGGSRWFLVEEGFAQMSGETLTLLTDRATPAESLSSSEAEKELAEANGKVAQGGKNLSEIERSQKRALAKLAMSKSASQRGGI
ncbi:MAG TPA: F0F1 ATP synthase subunit epsilon [Phycisphaerales bacterium]|nr:F0F1 ATP synthase subunit epsilon [Phycisphaerales bacterium]